ncbi:hypothetical protein ACIQVR_27170 [Streptomyces xanthochromogenes]|uniref:hypothetical protein n=1 Tax=Streptomyces xanthochromogenes TaxID=67384 RepID=UPI0038217BEF
MLGEPDTGRSRFDVSILETVPFGKQLLTRCAAPLEGGAQKYSSRSRVKADSAAGLENMKTSAFRHFVQRLKGETHGDHAAAGVFNLAAAEMTAYRIEQESKNGEPGV